MSLHMLATGTLLAAPLRREGRQGDFATATIRVQTQDAPILVSIIAFGEIADQLLSLGKGDAVSIAGRAKLSAWTGHDGAERHGLSIVAEQIASARPLRKADAATRGAHPQQRAPVRPDNDGMPDDPVGDLYRETDR
jgi:single-stranded DNA-binding protein